MSREPDPAEDLSARALAAAARALRTVNVLMPHLAGLAHLVRLSATPRASTAGVFASGRLVVNPQWFLGLLPAERVFVLAHEIMHLALRTHQRCGSGDIRLFNIAHDYIINDMLRSTLGSQVPANGLDWPGAPAMSAEQILAWLQAEDSRGARLPTRAWSPPKIGSLGEALIQAGLGHAGATRPEQELDVYDEALERSWYPDEPIVPAIAKAVEAAGEQTLALGVWRERLEAVFTPPVVNPSPPQSALVRALAMRTRPPWELALQRWLEDAVPGTRSFGRASRRQGDRTDLVLPGRRREGWTLNLVLDTSGSMSSHIAPLLGLLKTFCEALGVHSLRILQCGEKLEADEIVRADQLDTYPILGGGGGDLKPGLLRLAEDPQVEAALVITDGCEDYPSEPMPFEVLWALTPDGASWFAPSYGTVLRMEY